MLLSVFVFFNSFLRKKLSEGRSVFDVDFEDFCSFINEISSQSPHSHGNKGKSKNGVYRQTNRKYSRYLITFHNGQMDVRPIEISLMYCREKKSHHALLPAVFIMPKYQYSVQFIMSVLIYWDSHKDVSTACSIADRFNVPRSTIYRWRKDYSNYVLLYKKYLNESLFSCFIHAFSCDPVYLISEICNCLNLTSFSKERTNHCEHVT
jgi:hypothetical protein